MARERSNDSSSAAGFSEPHCRADNTTCSQLMIEEKRGREECDRGGKRARVTRFSIRGPRNEGEETPMEEPGWRKRYKGTSQKSSRDIMSEPIIR